MQKFNLIARALSSNAHVHKKKSALMSRLLMTVAVLWCGLSSLSAQAQSADTLRLNATYNNGIWQSSDTTLPYNAKVVVPQTVSLSGGSSGTYSLRLRYKAGIDTLALTYEVSGNTGGERIGTLSSTSADTLYTNYLSFAITQGPNQSGATQASVNIGYWPSAPLADTPCITDSTACERVCNNGFALGICGIGGSSIDDAANWTNGLFTPDYFRGNNNVCSNGANFSVPNNGVGKQVSADGDIAYAGLAFGSPGAEGRVEFMRQTITNKLLQGRLYVASFQANRADKAKHGGTNIGIRISSPNSADHTIVHPNVDGTAIDTTHWTQIAGTFTAAGSGPVTVMIGQWNGVRVDNINPTGTFDWAYYYIDDVHLTLVPDTADVTRTIACGATLLGQNVCGAILPRNIRVQWRIGGINGDTIANAHALAYNAIPPVGTTVYTRIVTISGIKFTTDYTITVVPPVAANIQGNELFCLSATTNFSTSSIQNINYVWSVVGSPAGVTIVNPNSATNPQISFANAGVYTVRLSTTAGSNACQQTTIKTVYVVNPNIQLIEPVYVCKNGPNARLEVNIVQDIALPTNFTTSYQWFNGTIAIDDATYINYSATTSGQYTVQVTIANANGTATCVKMSEPFNIVVTPAPANLSITNAPNNDIACMNQELTLYSSVINTNDWNYTWSVEFKATGATDYVPATTSEVYVEAAGGVTDQIFTFLKNGTFKIRLKLTSKTNDNCVYQAIKEISVPDVAISIDSPSSYACAPNGITLVATTNGIGTITWFDESDIPVGTGAQFIPAIGSHTYYATIASNNCIYTSNTFDTYVVGNPIPSDFDIQSPSVYCANKSLNVIFDKVIDPNAEVPIPPPIGGIPNPPTGDWNYVWSVINPLTNAVVSYYQITSGSNTPTPTFIFTGGGKYIITLKVSNIHAPLCFYEYAKEISIVGNCCIIDRTVTLNDVTILGDPYQTTNYTVLPTSPTNKYYVVGNINLNQSMTLESATFFVRGTATIDGIGGEVTGNSITVKQLLDANNTLTLKGCRLKAACDTMWGGIIADASIANAIYKNVYVSTNLGQYIDNEALKTDSTRIEDSFGGIRFVGTKAGYTINNTVFRNNMLSIQFINTGAGNNNKYIYGCYFTSAPSAMKHPFKQNAENNEGEYFYSYAHIFTQGTFGIGGVNGSNKLVRSKLVSALYGIYAPEHNEGIIRSVECRFDGNKIAGIWHTGGGLAIASSTNFGAGIVLPNAFESTWQINTERTLKSIPHKVKSSTLTLSGPVYGIYAENGGNSISNQLSLLGTSLTQTQTLPNGVTLQMDQIGFYGKNTTFSIGAILPDGIAIGNYGYANTLSNLRTAIKLEGTTGDYAIKINRFINNLTAVHINRNNPFSLILTCNDFISKPTVTNGTTYLARTGLLLTGTGAMNYDADNNISTLGTCGSDFANNNVPNGNEIRNLESSSNPTPPPFNAALPSNFTFINNQLPLEIQYRSFNNERPNVSNATVTNVGVNFGNSTNGNNCPQDATVESCRNTAAGVANRAGQGDSKPAISRASMDNAMPNPSNENGTTIGYELPYNTVEALLVVRNNLGTIVRTEQLKASENQVHISTAGLASGLYTYSLIVEGRLIKSRKLAVVK